MSLSSSDEDNKPFKRKRKTCGATSQTDDEIYVNIDENAAQTSDYLLEGSCEVENLRKDIETKNKEFLDIFRKREQEMSEMIKGYQKRLEEYEKQQKTEIELLNNKLALQTSLSEKYKERSDSLLAQRNEYEAKLEKAKMSDPLELQQLRDEAKNLQEILKLEQRANQKNKDKLTEVMEKCKQLQVDYERATKLLETQPRNEKIENKELSTLMETSATGHAEEFDNLTAQLLELQDRFDHKCEEIQKLKEDLKTLRKQENKGQSKCYECPLCGLEFTSPELIAIHCEQHHNT